MHGTKIRNERRINPQTNVVTVFSSQWDYLMLGVHGTPLGDEALGYLKVRTVNKCQ